MPQLIANKYELLRPQIQHGDMILFRGKGLMGSLICASDNSYYSHIGIVFKSQDRFFIIDSNKHGVSPKFLSTVIAESVDFCIVRPLAWSESNIINALNKIIDAAEKNISYDFGSIIQILLYRKLHITCHFDNDNRDTCSEFVRRYVRQLSDPVSSCFEQSHLPTNFIAPWDFILYADSSFTILFDESKRTCYRKK